MQNELSQILIKLKDTQLSAAASVFIALMSLLVSIMSLGLTVWESHNSRKHNRISVRPHIGWHRKVTISGPLEIILESNGLGPAIIKSITTILDGNEYTVHDIYSLLNDHVAAVGLRADIVNLDSGSPVRAGDEISIIKFNISDEQIRKRDIAKMFLKRVEFRCIYESFYGETFVSDSKNDNS